MKIVSSNLNFILLEIVDEKSSNAMNLILTHTNHYPRKLEPKKFKKFKLRLNGIEQKEKLKSELKNFIDNYLDIEETKTNILDFWSDGHQIGEFKVDNYLENITELNKEDWIENYQDLLDLYYKEYDQTRKDSVLLTKFLDRLKNLNVEEQKKYTRKAEFFKNDKDKLDALNDRMNLANQVEQIRQQFISEYKNNG